MTPYEVIVYEKDKIIFHGTVIAKSEYAAIWRAAEEEMTLEKQDYNWEELTILVRPFGK